MAKSSKTNNIYINGKQAGQTLNDLRKESRRLNNEINQMAPGTEAYKKKVQELGGVKKQLTDHRNELKKVEGSYNNVKTSMGGIKSMVGGFLGAGAIVGAVRGIVKGAGEWIKTNAKLSASLSSLEALTGASAKDLEYYKKEAIAMGSTTTQTATQVVDAMKLIGSSKPELLGNREALSQVTEETIRLSEAAQMDLVPAADALTGALNQWGKGADQASRFTNVLAAGSKSGAANIESLGQSIDKSGAVMAGYNIEIEEGVGLLETLAEKNIKGAEAGTQLRNVLLTMQGVEALPADAIARLEEYGVNTDIVKDKTQPLNLRLAEMSKISEDATAMMKVFGRQNIVAANAILQNTDKVQHFTDAVTDTNVAMEQQKINNDNLEGDMKSLGSAWEGMTLTIGSGEGAIRKVVQAGTSMLNWVTNTVNAFSEWDITKIETQLLKLVDTILSFIPGLSLITEGFRSWIAEKIRMNELTSSVIDNMKDEQRSLAILTSTLQDNNKQLKEGNLTEEETIAIKEENAKVIDKLNEKFPELTENIDLQTASNQELTNWQKQASQAILDGAIAEAKAVEQKRIINAIIEETIELRKQEIKEAERWAVTNWFADIFADDAEDMRENIVKAKGQLESLEDDFKHVEGTIKDLDLNFVIDFETANEAIDNQEKRIKSLRNDIRKAKSEGADIRAMEAQLKAEVSVLEAANTRKKEIKEEELREEAQLVQEAQETVVQQQKKANEEAAKAQRKQLETLQKELEKLKEFEEKINEDKNRAIALANKEGFDKELLEAEYKIEDKYKKEIASATELAKQKGAIGEKAADQLAMLEILKQEELMSAKAEIQVKQAEKQTEIEVAEAEKRKAAMLRVEDSLWNTKMTVLQMKLEETGTFEVEKRRAILEEITQLEKEKALLDFERKQEALLLEYENDALQKEEFNILMEELEQEHQMKLTEIAEEGNEQRNALTTQQIENTLTAAQMAVDAFSALMKSESEMTKSQIDKEKNERINALDIALNANEISQREYDDKVAAIEADADERKKAAMIEEFEREKKLSLLQVAIDTARGIMSAIAQFGPPPSPMGILGIATAGVVGIAQAAAISAKQAPQFKDGGYTTVTGAQDGKSYNARIKGKAKAGMLHGGPQLVLANEQGPEYFVPNPMLNNPEVIDHVRAIENIRVRQFAEGGATDQLPTSTTDVSTATENNPSMNLMISYMEQNNQILSELRTELQNIQVVIGDDKIDQLMDKMDQIQEMRA